VGLICTPYCYFSPAACASGLKEFTYVLLRCPLVCRFIPHPTQVVGKMRVEGHPVIPFRMSWMKRFEGEGDDMLSKHTVSYTHLTLPTICSV